MKKQLEQLLARVAAMQIPIYAGNASFFLLLSVFPIVSLLFVAASVYTTDDRAFARPLRAACAGVAAAAAGIFYPDALRLKLGGDHLGQRRADALVGLKGDAEPALRA